MVGRKLPGVGHVGTRSQREHAQGDSMTTTEVLHRPVARQGVVSTPASRRFRLRGRGYKVALTAHATTCLRTRSSTLLDGGIHTGDGEAAGRSSGLASSLQVVGVAVVGAVAFELWG